MPSPAPKKPTTISGPAQQPASAPSPKLRVVAGGIEPGCLRGAALQHSSAPVREDDPDKIIAEVKAMDSKQYRRYLKTPGNREKVEAACAARGKNVNR